MPDEDDPETKVGRQRHSPGPWHFRPSNALGPYPGPLGSGAAAAAVFVSLHMVS